MSKTTTGEVIHTCGWLHPDTTPCLPQRRNTDKMGNDYYMPAMYTPQGHGPVKCFACPEPVNQADGLGDDSQLPESTYGDGGL